MTLTSLTVLGDSGKEYVVTATLEGLRCTCPDWRHRRQSNTRVCKHIRFAKNLLKG